MEDTYGIIYLITNKVNGKVYVGQTTDSAESRWKQHLLGCKRFDGKFPKALRKYLPEDFFVEVIAEAYSRSELNFLEILMIEVFNSYRKGYNSTRGGEGHSVEYTDEQKKRLSEISKNSPKAIAHRRRLTTIHKGSTHSPELCKKMSEIMKQVPITPETRAKIAASMRTSPLVARTIETMASLRRGKKLGPQTPEQIRKRTEAMKATKARKREEKLFTKKQVESASELPSSCSEPKQDLILAQQVFDLSSFSSHTWTQLNGQSA